MVPPSRNVITNELPEPLLCFRTSVTHMSQDFGNTIDLVVGSAGCGR